MILYNNSPSVYIAHSSTNLFSEINLLFVCLPGVTVLAVAIDQADTEELRRAVTDGSTQNILSTRDAAQLNTLHTDLADLLCGVARIPEVRTKYNNKELKEN